MNPNPEQMPSIDEIDIDQALAEAWHEFELNNPDVTVKHVHSAYPSPRKRRRSRRGQPKARVSCETVITSRGTERKRPLPPPNPAMRNALKQALTAAR